ncbi:hypothetical protein KGA66_13530 [Actinocrinis puniceicyclus]|uniref:Uncharacterized protein n=1 Tax=Actinocrinis puniceicyclus TaxID=977794 RepID=A0A8J8BCE7_9ACTN|nr:hypothetical protein [Actinocrinis puniceicyclus]MBS2964073.1 hypothetical protein [Actinocrinis puniceicyclus]
MNAAGSGREDDHEYAAPGRRRGASPHRAVLLLGVALVSAVADPTRLAGRGPAGWLCFAAAVVAAIWAAPAVARRPIVASARLGSRLVRHRNSAFAVGCTIVAGFSDPPVWLTALDAVLLSAYLLAVDAVAAGPVGVRQLRDRTAALAAPAAIAVVLLAARSPVHSGAVWGRIVAALALAAAAAAAGAALWIRQAAAAAASQPEGESRSGSARHR